MSSPDAAVRLLWATRLIYWSAYACMEAAPASAGQPPGLLSRSARAANRAKAGLPSRSAKATNRAKAGIDAARQGFTSGVARLRGRGAGVARQPVPRGVTVDSRAGRRRGPG